MSREDSFCFCSFAYDYYWSYQIIISKSKTDTPRNPEFSGFLLLTGKVCTAYVYFTSAFKKRVDQNYWFKFRVNLSPPYLLYKLHKPRIWCPLVYMFFLTRNREYTSGHEIHPAIVFFPMLLPGENWAPYSVLP